MVSSKVRRHLGFSLLIAASSISYAGLAQATDSASFMSLPAVSLPGFLKTDDSLSRLATAYDELRQDARISGLLQNSEHSFALDQRVSDSMMETTKFQHYYKGLEVVGSMALHHRTENGTFVTHSLASFDLNTEPTLTVQTAASLAQSLNDNQEVQSLPALKILPSDQGDNANLVYWVDLKGNRLSGGREVVLDAHSGKVIANVSKHISLAPVQVYNAHQQGLVVTLKYSNGGTHKRKWYGLSNELTAGRRPPSSEASAPASSGQPALLGCDVVDLKTGAKQSLSPDQCNQAANTECQLVESQSGDPISIQPQNCSQAADATAQQAQRNADTVLQYYQTVFGRSSYDARGGSVVSVVHVGVGFDNAYWDWEGNYMAYGDGDGKQMGDFSHALDVAGHEMTHGVTTHTAKLLNWGQSGALNEANSDFFGIVIAGESDWVIGRGVFLDPSESGGIRNLANPAALSIQSRGRNGKPVSIPYPSTLAQAFPYPSAGEAACDETNDNCWVHINATINGHAEYLVAQAIGVTNAEKLYYTVLTQFLTPRTTMQGAATAAVQACQKVFNDSTTCGKVQQAYSQVGLL